METLKVSTKSNPNSVAGAVAGAIRQTGAVEIQVVGAGALNQAIKAVAIARGYVAASGIDLVCIPTFADIVIDGERRTAIRVAVQDRNRSDLPATPAPPFVADRREEHRAPAEPAATEPAATGGQNPDHGPAPPPTGGNGASNAATGSTIRL